VNGVDVAMAVALLAFVAWGALHGALRQVLGFVVLVAAFALAGALGPRIEGGVAKVVTLSDEGLSAASWVVVFVGTAIAGGIAIHMLHQSLDHARLAKRVDVALGALIGVAKGAVILGVLTYGVLGWYADEEGPGIVRTLRESKAAEAVVRAETRLRPALGLPPRVENRVERVNSRVAGPPRKPR
jgi:uncharacterized membrane protein required for colicin V production